METNLKQWNVITKKKIAKQGLTCTEEFMIMICESSSL